MGPLIHQLTSGWRLPLARRGFGLALANVEVYVSQKVGRTQTGRPWLACLCENSVQWSGAVWLYFLASWSLKGSRSGPVAGIIRQKTLHPFSTSRSWCEEDGEADGRGTGGRREVLQLLAPIATREYKLSLAAG